jgi:hypothetical protein
MDADGLQRGEVTGITVLRLLMAMRATATLKVSNPPIARITTAQTGRDVESSLNTEINAHLGHGGAVSGGELLGGFDSGSCVRPTGVCPALKPSNGATDERSPIDIHSIRSRSGFSVGLNVPFVGDLVGHGRVGASVL